MRPGENIGLVIARGQSWNGVAMFRNADDSNQKIGGVRRRDNVLHSSPINLMLAELSKVLNFNSLGADF